MEKKENKSDGMKTAEHTMAKDKTKNRGEFISKRLQQLAERGTRPYITIHESRHPWKNHNSER